jgi:hypothetical protein
VDWQTDWKAKGHKGVQHGISDFSSCDDGGAGAGGESRTAERGGAEYEQHKWDKRFRLIRQLGNYLGE